MPPRVPPSPPPPASAVGPSPRERRTVALAVSGSIAAYKAVMVARLLVKAGLRVVPLMTRSAKHFVGPLTLSGVCGEPVHSEMLDPEVPGELHVELGRVADLVLLVPATADLLARLAQGRADDLVTALALCARGPVLAAPAMHPRMWEHPATRRNVVTLAGDGRVELVGPVAGEVASGDEGMGRMAEPEAVVAAALARLGTRDLEGLRLVVTAGPTNEDLDPVRFLGNRSTGKMGFAVAERAAARGASVTLIAGPVTLSTPWGVERVDVRSAMQMRAALWRALGGKSPPRSPSGRGAASPGGEPFSGADALVMTAAVADYRPARAETEKIKRSGAPRALDLVANPDLLAEVGAARRGRLPVLVGFAVETAGDEAVAAAARGKLERKRVDLVVANHAAESFGRDDDRAMLVDHAGVMPFGVLRKTELADRVLDRVLTLWRGASDRGGEAAGVGRRAPPKKRGSRGGARRR